MDKDHTMLAQPPIGQLLTVQEVMATLKVGRGTVYKLIRNGRLEVLKISTQKSRITERSLNTFLNEIAEKR